MSERCVHFPHKMGTLAGKGLIPRLAALLLENAENRVVAGMTHKRTTKLLRKNRHSPLGVLSWTRLMLRL